MVLCPASSQIYSINTEKFVKKLRKNFPEISHSKQTKSEDFNLPQLYKKELFSAIGFRSSTQLASSEGKEEVGEIVNDFEQKRSGCKKIIARYFFS